MQNNSFSFPCWAQLTGVGYWLLLASLSFHCASTASQNRAAPSADTLAKLAVQKFMATPRTIASAKAAYDLSDQASRQAGKDDPYRFDYALQSAQYAVWISYHSEDKGLTSRFANQARQHAQRIIALDDQRVEGYYYRAIAAGLFAEQNRLVGKGAVQQIRADLMAAIDLDPAFDYGGPHRVLGAVYLRSPGPPAGIGSVRRALFHLQEGYRIAEGYPENMLFLAEVYIKLGQTDDAEKLLAKLKTTYSGFGDASQRGDWSRRAADLSTSLKTQ